jgi:hypothetical protein
MAQLPEIELEHREVLRAAAVLSMLLPQNGDLGSTPNTAEGAVSRAAEIAYWEGFQAAIVALVEAAQHSSGPGSLDPTKYGDILGGLRKARDQVNERRVRLFRALGIALAAADRFFRNRD